MTTSPDGTSPMENQYPNLTTEELEIVGYFAKGQKCSISTDTLRLQSSETSIRLINNSEKLIGISKQVNQWQRKVLINQDSACRSSIIKILTDEGFILKRKSSHPDFTEYHHYQVPDGYKLNYSDVLHLWKVWWNNKRYQLHEKKVSIDILIFSKGNWYPVRDLQPNQGNFILKTDLNELSILAGDLAIWLDRSPPEATPIINHHHESMLSTQAPEHLTSNTNSLTATIPISDTSLEQDDLKSLHSIDQKIEEDLDLETYLNTFNTEDTEDIDQIEGIYHIGELLNQSGVDRDFPPSISTKPSFKLAVSVVKPIINQEVIAETPKLSIEIPARATQASAPTSIEDRLPSLSITERKKSLKIKAIETLNSYLQDGETITHTELLKNGQGVIVNRKVTTVQRSSPRWTIEQIRQLEDELAKI